LNVIQQRQHRSIRIEFDQAFCLFGQFNNPAFAIVASLVNKLTNLIKERRAAPQEYPRMA
jgi:hypothetical protein